MPKKDPTEQIIARHLAFLEAAGFRPVPDEFERIRALTYASELDSLDRIIELLGLEQGEVPSPFAAAATFIAYELAPDRQHEVLDRLHEFAGKGATAALQVTELAWVLGEGNPPQH